MASKHGKRFRALDEKIDGTRNYSLSEALDW